MLERLESIKKVGLFEDYKHSANCELGEVTLIYGENGVGKSTIAAILDSLRERNANEIIRRTSLPGDVPSTAAISIDGKIYSFNGHDWDNQLPYDTIDVFYPGFVSRNVHTVSSIDPKNRRNLCELILGRKAVEKIKRLAKVDDEAREKLAKKSQIEKQLILLIKKPDILEIFLDLPNDPDIDEKLEKARSELKQALNRDAILTKVVPQPVTLPEIDHTAIELLLEKSANDLGKDVATVIREHVTQHLDIDGENWLDYGAKHIGADNKCPFCAQDFTSSNLVKAIRSYFSIEYRTYTDTLSAEIQEIRKVFSSTAFQQVHAALASQMVVASQWTDEIKIDQHAIEVALVKAESEWKLGEEKLEELIASKQAQPLSRINSALANTALVSYKNAIEILNGVNDILTTGQKMAEQQKTTLSKTDTHEIEERVHRLENQKVRFEPLALDLLDKRNDLLKKRSMLEEEKKVLKEAIDEQAGKVVSKYQVGINYYLDYFGCDIRIESVEPKFPSGKASVQYKLKVHGHEIPLGFSEDWPCFETVLGEGDKLTLALSFFFARLRDHEDLTGRVVVLDDPVNSLGSSRRSLIEGVIRDLRARGAQVVVLTHDMRLAALMWRDKKLNNIVTLQVERTGNSSQLKPWDIERATQSKYVEDYLTLVDYLEKGGVQKAAAGSIRSYVEQRLRYLYPGLPFKTRDSLGVMIGKIRISTPGTRLHPLHAKLDQLESINDAALPSHHATDDDPGMSPLTPEEVRLFAQKALKVLE